MNNDNGPNGIHDIQFSFGHGQYSVGFELNKATKPVFDMGSSDMGGTTVLKNAYPNMYRITLPGDVP